MHELLSTLHSVANFKLFMIAGTQVTVLSLATALTILFVGFKAAGFADRAVGRALAMRRLQGFEGVRRLLRYVVLLTSFGVSMNTIGIDVSALFAAGAIFAVGLGFAMQSIAQNFVSGVILLVERNIRPGDVLNVGGRMVQVEDMGIRATIVRTLDDEHLIVPNAQLSQASVANYTFKNSFYRIRCVVGVSYGANMEKVRATLEAVGHALNEDLTGAGAKKAGPTAARRARRTPRAPLVSMLEFGNSAVQWELSVWVDDPWSEQVLKSRFLEAMWDAFAAADITIAYPQLDVHIDGVAPAANLSRPPRPSEAA